MRRLLVCLVLLLAAAPSAAHARFVFHAPPGWTDLSAGAPAANFEGLPPQLLQMIKGGGFAFYAADLVGASDGFMENLNVTVQGGSEPITEAFVDKVLIQMDEEVRKQGGAGYKVLEKGTVTVSGARCGRYVGDLTLGAQTIRQVGYLLPGRAQHAILTFSTTPAMAATYVGIFDAAAQATGGIEEPESRLGRIGASALRGGVIGGIGGGIVGLWLWFTRRRRRAASSQI